MKEEQRRCQERILLIDCKIRTQKNQNGKTLEIRLHWAGEAVSHKDYFLLRLPKWKHFFVESVCWVPPRFALAASIGECCPFQSRLHPCSKWLCYCDWGWVVCQDHWPALSLMQSMDWPGTVPNTSLCEPQSVRWVEVYVSVETLLGVGRMAWGFVVGCCRVTAFYLIHLSSSTPCSQSLSSDSPFQMKASFALRYEKTRNTEKMRAGGGKL